jgi:hypothetical protein
MSPFTVDEDKAQEFYSMAKLNKEQVKVMQDTRKVVQSAAMSMSTHGPAKPSADVVTP